MTPDSIVGVVTGTFGQYTIVRYSREAHTAQLAGRARGPAGPGLGGPF